MSQQKHTPTPYDLGPTDGGLHLIIAPDGEAVTARVVAEVLKVEDAYFIREACNAYDAFLSGLRAIEQLASHYEASAERLSYDRAQMARRAAQSMRAVVAEVFARATREQS